jgi:tubulin polyglutamylase TTLL5
MELLWSRCYDLIIKTIACGEHYVLAAMKKNNMYRLNCFEVFGFDILVDSDLKPWLVEVNLSPSLATDSPLDMVIKTTLVTDTFNLIGIKRFDRRKESLNKLKYRNKNGAFSGGGAQTIGSGLGKAKAYTVNTAFSGSIPLPTTGSNDCFL